MRNDLTKVRIQNPMLSDVISLIEENGTNTKVHLCRRNNLLGSMDGQYYDSLRSHSLYWTTEMIAAITAGTLG